MVIIIFYNDHYEKNAWHLQAIPASTLPYSQHEPRDWDIPRGLLYSLTLITTIGGKDGGWNDGNHDTTAEVHSDLDDAAEKCSKIKIFQGTAVKVSSQDLDVLQVWSILWWGILTLPLP